MRIQLVLVLKIQLKQQYKLQFPRKKLIFKRRVAANRPRSTDHIRTCCGTCKKGSEAQRIEPTTQGLPGGALLRGGGAEREQQQEQG